MERVVVVAAVDLDLKGGACIRLSFYVILWYGNSNEMCDDGDIVSLDGLHMPDDGDIVSLGLRAEGISHPNNVLMCVCVCVCVCLVFVVSSSVGGKLCETEKRTDKKMRSI